jgi:ribosomal protein S13
MSATTLPRPARAPQRSAPQLRRAEGARKGAGACESNRAQRQREQALAKGNGVRIGVARLKQELKAGEVTLRDALEARVAQNVKVGPLALAVCGIGPSKVRRALRAIGATETDVVRTLTPQQRDQLAAALRARPGFRGKCAPDGDPAIRAASLAKAMQARQGRSAVRSQLARGEITLEQALTDPRGRCLRVTTALSAPRRSGEDFARRCAARAKVALDRKLGELTDNERARLVAAWEHLHRPKRERQAHERRMQRAQLQRAASTEERRTPQRGLKSRLASVLLTARSPQSAGELAAELNTPATPVSAWAALRLCEELVADGIATAIQGPGGMALYRGGGTR